jgi:hypothetical protein
MAVRGRVAASACRVPALLPGRLFRILAMNPLFRPSNDLSSRARALRPLLGAVLVASAFGAQAQQWTRGEALWTANGCAGCHVGAISLASMQQRFTTIAAARAAADAVAARDARMAIWNALTTAQKDDASAYVAGWRAEANLAVTAGNATMSATAVGQTAQATLSLFNNGRAPLRVAVNSGQTVSGDVTQFRIQNVGTGCDAQTVNAGQSCQVTVIYQPTSAPATQHSYTVRFAHNGEPTASTQLTVTGRIAAAPAPAPTPSPTPAPAPAPSSGGGGALPLALWAALLPAALLARRRRT